MAVRLGYTQQAVNFYDFKGNANTGGPDRKLDRGEMAHAAQDLLLNARNGKDEELGSMFATILQGGVDGRGFFSALDKNHDEAIDMCEFKDLAKIAGNCKAIGPDDFAQAFPNRYQEGGNEIDMRGLKLEAMQNLRDIPPGGNFDGDFGDRGFNDFNYGNDRMFKQQMLEMMGNMTQMMQLMLNNSGYG